MARIAGVTRARMTQVLDLNLLAPDLQERLLFLTRDKKIQPRTVAAISRVRDWPRQRQLLALPVLPYPGFLRLAETNPWPYRLYLAQQSWVVAFACLEGEP